jgi:addiction module HigA family antidote
MMAPRRLDPIHPGEILAEEFMKPFGLSANALSRALGVPVTRVSEILRGRRGVTADTALRLARFFGTSAELWLGLQAEHDLRRARLVVGAEIERRVPLAAEIREPVTSYRATSRARRKSPRGAASRDSRRRR